MTTNLENNYPYKNNIRLSAHAVERRHQRAISREAIEDAIATGSVARMGSGRLLFTGRDGTEVVTDASATVVVTTLGRRATRKHSRAGAGVSRHRRSRPAPKGRTDSRCPR